MRNYRYVCIAYIAVVRRSLHGGGTGAWPVCGRCRQVPSQTQVSFTTQRLGRRADRLLLQGALSARSQRLFRRQAIPDVRGKATAGRPDRTDVDTDR